MKVYTRPQELNIERWNGDNLDVIRQFCGEHRTRLKPEVAERHGLEIFTGLSWLSLPLGWWAVTMEDGNLGRMSPDYYEKYCHTELPNPAQQYYEAARAAELRLTRVALGVEKLAVEIADQRGYLGLGRYVQDELRKLLCPHPRSSMRIGPAQVWCDICLSRVEKADLDARAEELKAHIVVWCKCNTSNCPVHTKGNSDLPLPKFLNNPGEIRDGNPDPVL